MRNLFSVLTVKEYVALELHTLRILHRVCNTFYMMYSSPILFKLDDGTEVHVKKIANSKFDFELTFLNGNRKTFVWNESMPSTFTNKKG